MKRQIILLINFFITINAAEESYYNALQKKLDLLEERNHPRVRAFLEVIARSECGAAYFSDHKGYCSRYPSTVFSGFEKHPGEILCAASGNEQLCSSAAGRYMFLASVWNTIAQRLQLDDFSPLNQDIAALYLIKEKKALEDIKKGDIETAITKLNKIWASLPGAPYKQPVKRMKDLKLFYESRLAHFGRYLKAEGRS